MRRYFPLILVILFALPLLAGVEKAEIAIKGMHCQHCADRVLKALKETAGVDDVTVCHHKGVATVAYDSEKTDVKALESVIAGLGFDAGDTKTKEPFKCEEKECAKAAKAGCCMDARKSGCPAAKSGCPSGKK